MNRIAELVRGLRQIGFRTAVHALLYPRRRDALDKRFPLPAVDEAVRTVGVLVSVEQRPDGALFRFTSAVMTAQFLAPDLVFVGWNGAARVPSFAVSKRDWPGSAAPLEQSDGAWSLSSGSLELRVARDGSLRYLDGRGTLLREERPPVRRGRGWTQAATLQVGEAVYGLGGRAAPLDRRRVFAGVPQGLHGEPGELRGAPPEDDEGRRVYRFWNQDPAGAYTAGSDPLYICMPVYLCLRDSGAVLVFHDNTFDGACSLGQDFQVRFSDGPCRTYVIVGTPSSILQRYAELTGKPPLPPRWALGYQHSRWGFGSIAELRRVRKGFRDRGLPLGVLHVDIDHMRGLRTLTTDGKAFPGLDAFAREAGESGTRLVGIVDPGVKKDAKYPLYAEGRARRAFCAAPDGAVFHGVVWPGVSAFTDYTSAAARAWWGAQYEGELSRGIAGFWHDMNEPACFAGTGSATLPLSLRHDMEGRGGDHREAHNVYGMLMNQAGYEGLRRLRPDSRPFIVSRSGWAGMQRWSWSWTGDVETSWTALRCTPAVVLGLALCGAPYAGPDIGGFTGHPSAELFARWFELGSFLPFFRTHCAVHLPPREPWCFGPEVLAIAKKYMDLRASLLPYWYTQAWVTAETGLPLVRPLFWAEPGNSRLRNVDDAFLLGDDLLVSPVLEEGASTKSVRLPVGRWYDLGRDTFHPGDAAVTLPAPLDVVPVLARGGCIVAMTAGEELALHAYNPGDGSACRGTLYSDAGDGYGPHRLDTFTLSPSAEPGLFELSWTAEGDFPWGYATVTLVLHGFGGARVRVAGKAPSDVTVQG